MSADALVPAISVRGRRFGAAGSEGEATLSGFADGCG